MGKKIYKFGFIIIIILYVIFNVEFGGYYNTPEQAANHISLSDKTIKNIVETVWVEDSPIIFYVANSGEFCEVEFNKKNIFGMTGWEYRSIKFIETKEIKENQVIPSKMASGTKSDKKPQVLFGISRSPKANKIKVNGEVPTFKNFEIEGQEYVLWYITIDQTNDWNVDDFKITADSK